MSLNYDCYDYNDFKYCNVNNIFMLGDNSTNIHNALVSGKSEPDVVTIPRTVNGIAVQQIGRMALFKCHYIKKIIIEARITLINQNGFAEMKSLTFISLPNTLEYIYEWGIHLYNPEYPDGTPNPGSATIIFEPGSKLKHIGNHGISYKDTINIYICEPVNPLINKNGIVFINNLNIYSLHDFIINGTKSIIMDIPYCQRYNVINTNICTTLFHLSIYNFIFFAVLK